MESLEFPINKVMSLENRYVYFFLSGLDAFYFFSCLIALGSISYTTFNISGKSGYPCLPDFKRKAFIFSLINIMLVVSLMAFTPLQVPFSVYSLIQFGGFMSRASQT